MPGRISSYMIVFALLLLSGCLPKHPVVDITSAENIRKMPAGRIFITGREALFELQKDEENAVHAVAVVTSDDCNYLAGLAELHDWVFYVCVRMSGFSSRDLRFSDSGELRAYSLKDGTVVSVAALHDFQFPNGLDALTSEDAILIADEDFFKKNGGVSKARIDFSGAGPVLLDYQQHWIGAAQGVNSANGVRVVDNAIYVTDLGSFKRIPLNAGGVPGQAERLYHGATILDDFDAYCDGFIVADYLRGRLVYVTNEKSPPVTLTSNLNTPSAVLARGGPLFGDDEILVTESVGLSGGEANRLVSLTLPKEMIERCKVK